MKRFILYLLILGMLLSPLPSLASEAPVRTFGECTSPVKSLSIEDISFELGVIINIRIKASNCRMAAYYFGNIPDQPKADNHDWLSYSGTYLRVTKFPGDYYLWLRDTEGNMYGPTYVEMPKIYNTYFRTSHTKFPKEAISTYLPKYCNYTVEELDALIADNVAQAGIYTREAVVIGITVQFSKLQDFGIRIPFFFYGYWPVREYGWYLNPDWGTTYNLKTTEGWQIWTGKKPAEHEAGTHCNGFVHYAFRLAGLNVRNTGDMGETGDIGGIGKLKANKVGTYEGRGGDVLQSSTNHEMVIIDRYDDDMDGESDGYIVAESNNDEGGQVYCKKPFDKYSKYCKVFNMDGVFFNTATQQRMLKFWKNYHIPESAWPDYLSSAVREKTRYTIVFEDALGTREIKVPFQGTVDEMPAIRGLFDGHTAGAKWSEDITGKKIERNYLIRAKYEVEIPEDVFFVMKAEYTSEETPAPAEEPAPEAPASAENAPETAEDLSTEEPTDVPEETEQSSETAHGGA